MRSLPSRFSDWVVVHPVLWGVGSGVVLVLLGFALNLAPIVVIAAGAAIGVLNILHAKRRRLLPTSDRAGFLPGTSGGGVTVPGMQRRLTQICRDVLVDRAEVPAQISATEPAF